jgi:hypothetical protein
MTDQGNAEQTGELTDGVVQLRFADEGGTLRSVNAHEVAEVLQGLVEFTSDMAKRGLFGDGVPPEVRVRPVKEGSFILEVEAIVNWALQNPSDAIGAAGGVLSAGGAVVKGINVGLKKLRGTTVTDMTDLDNGNVKINWADGDVQEIPRAAWEQLNEMPKKTRRSLRKILAPLSDQADTLELRDASVEASTEDVMKAVPSAIATRAEYREAVIEPDDSTEETETFTAEATLESIDFRPGQKWRVKTSERSLLATIEDDEFLHGLDQGQPLHKNDIFEVTILENRTTVDGRTSRTWTVVKARRTKRGTDDRADVASQPPAA